MDTQVLIFAAVFVLAVGFFIYSCIQRFSLVAIGKPDNRVNEVGKRIGNMLLYAFGQRRVVSSKYPFGWNHFIFFWCFLTLMIANTEFLFHGLFPSVIALSLLPTPLYYTLAFIFDIVSAVALLAVIIAVSRRLFFPPKYIDARSRDAFVILSLVAALMIAFFCLHGSEIALGEEGAAAYMPISSLVGMLFAGISPAVLAGMVIAFWWIHALVLLGFLNYLPYSKHMHILAAIPNCFFRSMVKINTQEREQFAKENVYGADKVNQFRWKDLFDTYACTECGRCTDNCPANTTGKELNPRLVVHDMKINLLENGKLLKAGKAPVQALISKEVKEGSVTEESIWACTTCGACMEVCPVFIEHVPKIVEMRRNLVQMKAEFPEELLTLFENMETRSNPWGIFPGDRGKWATEVETPAFEKGKTEYLFYVGCAGSYDTRNKRNTECIAKILNKAGVSWGILGKDEKCCGDSLRRVGNEFVFDRMAKENVKQFQDLGVKKIIVECPHCYNTLKNDYKQYGADFEVIHHSQLILDLINAKKLVLKNKASVGKLVFHDSCYLGRYNSVFEQPRTLIKMSTGNAAIEMRRNKETSFCCGAGGGRMWMEENKGTRINLERVNEAMSTKADTICVCCPYCVTMMEDGLTDLKVADKVQVLEISELVEKALE